MRVVEDLPRRVRRVDHTWIPLDDGTRLGARIWLPEDAEQDPVPAVLEYIPYRKGDGTAPRDQSRHAYVAGHGYAVLRVDLRGSGESGGLLTDEYLPTEQEDALEVLRWIAAQPWCTGAVGMFGISWGGFNGLQVAARRPPELKAVITLCSTDDRYADDVHYRGGAVLALEMLSWGASMLSFNAIAPDPGGRGSRLARGVARAHRSAWSRTSTSGFAISAATSTGSRGRCARTTVRSSARSTPSGAGPTAIPRPCCGWWPGWGRPPRGCSDRGRTPFPTRWSPARRSAFSRNACAGGTPG